MSQLHPTREAAAAALSEARLRASQVHRSDRQLAWLLGVVAISVLGIGGLMSFAPHRVGPAVLGIYLTCIAVAVIVLLRIRAYSRIGMLLFGVSVSAFTLWNALVSGLSVATGWWGPTQVGYHFGVSEVIGVAPLVVGIWLIMRRGS